MSDDVVEGEYGPQTDGSVELGNPPDLDKPLRARDELELTAQAPVPHRDTRLGGASCADLVDPDDQDVGAGQVPSQLDQFGPIVLFRRHGPPSASGDRHAGRGLKAQRV
jgi:hypothetical protein